MITSHERPRLREDLVAEAIEDQGARFIDVIDPDTGNAYRFYDVEYALACAMDGERDVPGLVRWAQEELGIAPSPNELQTVISTLGELGYLDRGDSTAAGDLELAPTSARPTSVAPSGLDVELGHYRAEPVPAPVEPAADLELGESGPSPLVIDAPSADVALGPSGVPVPSLPVPARPEPRPRLGTDTSRESQRAVAAALPPREPIKRPSESQVLRAPEPSRPAARWPSDPGTRPSAPTMRASEPALPSPAPVEPATRPSRPGVRPSDPGLRGPSASDPSLNLSLPLRPDDVKEAVRASREMRSVDVPADLLEALEAAERPVPPPRAASSPGVPPPTPEPRAAASPPARPPSAVMPSAVPSPSVLDPIAPLSGAPLSMSEPISPPSVPPLVPMPRLESRPEAQAAAQVEYPRAAEIRPALAPAPRDQSAPVATPVATPQLQPRRSNAWIVVLLVLAILGVIGFGVWQFVLKERFAKPAPVSEVVTPTEAETPSAPPVPAAITAKLSLVKGAPLSIKMPTAGALQKVVEEGVMLKAGEEVAQLAGGKAIEQRIAEAKGDLEKRYPADIVRIKGKLEAAAGNKGLTARYSNELANREARVKQRTEDLASYEADLAKLSLTSEVAGKVTSAAKVGARLGAGAEVATIEPEAYLSGAANYGAPVSSTTGDALVVAIVGDEASTSSCTIETVQGTLVSFRCPLTDGFADGVEVTLDPK